ncbi:Deoxyribonuclease gamma [Liparis tanakae]|uniref:Deoxyribonuclease-1-like 1 n=1 Tax=Liparis tanakae TaxID=230148 RepID=A0A4Z2EK96_9TELE|nr:Deoxyribonuclease gamma [Liparis tanakae]
MMKKSKSKPMTQILERLCKFEFITVVAYRKHVTVCRTDTATLTGRYQYPDDQPGHVDAFSREPFVVRFKAPRTDIGEFVLIPQHTTPENATRELDALYDVLQHVTAMWTTPNVMLLGDFNADCAYLAKKNRKNVRLITGKNLYWLIPEKTDTTVRSSTSCTYDRNVSPEHKITPALVMRTAKTRVAADIHPLLLGIVVHGERFARAVVPLSARAFNFQLEYRLTEDQALEVSDHYPVEVLLKDRAHHASSNAAASLSLFLLGHFVFQMLTC